MPDASGEWKRPLEPCGSLETSVGYTGGNTLNPTYKDVCYKTRGTPEVVRIVFDPSIVSFETLLNVFWESHNPTELNRQGPDVGDQYRSAVFYTSPEQKVIAEASKAQHQAEFNGKIVTEIVPEAPYYLAEDYHQQYLAKRGMSSCRI